MRRWNFKLIQGLCVAALIYAVLMSISIFADRQNNEEAYDDLRQLYSSEAVDKPIESITTSHKDNFASSSAQESEFILESNMEEADSVSEPDIELPRSTRPSSFDELLKLNKEIIGWMYMEDTRIDYPVVQAKDNEYYLNHNALRKKNSGGALFLDYRNSIRPASSNLIVYGHHMKDGSMFKDLVKFKDELFFVMHPTFEFNTLNDPGTWEVFSVYSTTPDFNYIVPDFDSEKEYVKFLNKLRKKSIYKREIKFTGQEQILTLSTCDYAVDEGRLVVHARKIE